MTHRYRVGIALDHKGYLTRILTTSHTPTDNLGELPTMELAQLWALYLETYYDVTCNVREVSELETEWPIARNDADGRRLRVDDEIEYTKGALTGDRDTVKAFAGARIHTGKGRRWAIRNVRKVTS